MLKKAGRLTLPSPADISPARPESAKTASSPKDAPCPKQGRSELSFYYGVAGMIPTARHHNSSFDFQGWPGRSSIARVERGHSHSLTSPEGVGRLFFTARIERPPLYRGGSASKKNGLPAPSHHSEAARCASKGIVPATPHSFQHPASRCLSETPIPGMASCVTRHETRCRARSG